MSYHEYRIKEIVEKIGRNDMYLPAIQRKFVWDREQIESLFDSIMRGYPIGTFLFWFVRGDNKDNYTFYKFIQEYHERDRYRNEVAPHPELKDEIIGVLDGQQRLGSMYIALQGTYAYKRPYARWENDNAFPKRRFYLNLLHPDVARDEEDFLYEFRFLTDREATRVDEGHLWFLVRDVLRWERDPALDEYYDQLLERGGLSDEVREAVRDKRDLVKRTLRILHQRLVLEELISYFAVEEQDLDNILDVFVRVNSGGTILSKSDLLFSTIVANWQPARDEIEDLLETINHKGEGFWFNNDFVMRTCLVLTDSPVLFKVRSFRKDNIDRVMAEWNSIRAAIEASVDLLAEFGFSGENLTSMNAVIPIAYYFKKGGHDDSASRQELRKYLIHALLKRTFGGQGDQVLSSIRTSLATEENGGYVLRQRSFSVSELMDTVKLPGDRTLRVADDDIEEILEYRKGVYSFMTLSLLYPNLRLGQVKFHQDHVHPASQFADAPLRSHAINMESWERWRTLRDQLPNLQLMEGAENEKKNRTPFEEWLRGTDSNGAANVTDPEKFKADNYIPGSVSLEFKHFEAFFEARKDLLRDKLRLVLK